MTAKKRARTTRRPRKQKVSIQELKFWLSGILEFQDKEWTPNKEQWENIKTKIFDLEEPEPPEKKVEVVHITSQENSLSRNHPDTQNRPVTQGVDVNNENLSIMDIGGGGAAVADDTVVSVPFPQPDNPVLSEDGKKYKFAERLHRSDEYL